MSRQRLAVAALLAAGWLMLLAGDALAQTSGIAGAVRDVTGGVLPGVTVEVQSPALIEKARTAVTNEQGLYRILDLRVGMYTVTFTLAGFTTVKRDGVELSANFTATINADLRVGGVEETITVSGQSPVVDVQNTAVRNIIEREVLDAVPTGRASAALVALTPGVIMDTPTAQDVGGAKGEQSVRSGIHGGRPGDLRQFVDGIEVNMRHGAERQFQPVSETAQEIVYDLGGGSAESQLGGIRVNFIPKDGGNTFSGNFLANGTNSHFQGSNLSDDLIRRGLSGNNINKVKNIWDISGSLGGPVKQDRLWVFTSQRWWSSANYVAASFENATPDAWVYAPDVSRPGLNDYENHSHNVRLTWQISKRNRLRTSYDYQWRCDCHRPVTSTNTPEASWFQTYPANVLIATWAFPASDRLLFEAGTSRMIYHYYRDPQPGSENRISVLDTGLNLRYRANATYENWNNWNSHTRSSMSYVTGSHAVKVGLDWNQVTERDTERSNQALNYTFRNGVPISITLYANPFEFRDRLNADLGLYAQDQWTIRRLTLNYGVRFDYINASVDEQHLPAGPYVSARDYDGVSCALCYTDLSPRLSASYDLFGNGKTALKVGFGGFVSGSTRARTFNPVQNSVKTATRAWDDRNGDFVPQESELGPLSDSNFGGQRIGTEYADDARSGFGHRPYNWQGSASVQHELLPGTAVNFGYFRTAWENFTATDNIRVTPDDFDPYCITVPVDPRLPQGGGYQLCGWYDIKPGKFGQVDNLVTLASHYGERTEVYNGFDLTIHARLPRGAYVGGGMNTGRTVTNDCDSLVDSPAKNFCEVVPPFFRPQVKLHGSYPLPFDVQVSAAFQSLPGIPIEASYSATLAEIVPTLGRVLAGNVRSVVLPNLFEPQTRFEGRINQMDVRVTKRFSVSGLRLHAKFDVYNLLNASPVLATNARYGPTWLQPAQIMDARLAKFEVQVQF